MRFHSLGFSRHRVSDDVDGLPMKDVLIGPTPKSAANAALRKREIEFGLVHPAMTLRRRSFTEKRAMKPANILESTKHTRA